MEDKCIPDELRKEIRACAVLRIQDFLFTEKPQIKMHDQFDWFFDSFHGNASKNITSQLDLVLTGYKTYSGLWESCVDPKSTLANPSTALRLKPFLSRDKSTNYFIGTS